VKFSFQLLKSWRFTLLLSIVSVASFAFGAGPTDSAPVSAELDANGQPPRLLSAFFGLDDSLPFGANRLCLGAWEKDGMPVVLSHTIDAETLQAEDFRVFTRAGGQRTPLCVTLRPSLDAGEKRTVLLIGEFGDAANDPPVRVLVVDDLKSDGTVGEQVNFRGAETQVIPLEDGPTLVWAAIVPQKIWSQSGRGSSCPTNTQQVVRVTWAGGVKLPSGEEPGDTERALYRVTLTHPDGSRNEVTPASLADLGDNDNNHFLCLDTSVPATAVAFPAGHLVDPNGDLNPDSQIAVIGAAEIQADLHIAPDNTEKVDTEKDDIAHGEAESKATPASDADDRPVRFYDIKLPLPAATINGDVEQAAGRNAYFGDLHVHTTYSFDAFAFGTMATPDDAYRYARGEAIRHPGGFDLQLRKPLDFYAVTDHAMFLGLANESADTRTAFSKYPHIEYMHDLNAPENRLNSATQRRQAFGSFLADNLFGIDEGDVDGGLVNDIIASAWADIVAAAKRHNEPGKFTTLVGYEYTSSGSDRGNLHRNVIFRGADRLPEIPFSRFNDINPEALWDWMDDLREQGIESLAIPHNSNGSNGQMFKLVDWAGDPMDDEYAAKRLRNEPLIEITQIKGTSETHPMLSDNDEWAGFEIMPYRIATTIHSEKKGSYAREALINGLAFEDKGVRNPYKFGFIGSSDTHTGATPDEESNYVGKLGLLDAAGTQRGSVPLPVDQVQPEATNQETIDGRIYVKGANQTWSAAGLAGVWAEENTRDAIYDALRRKETFATSGSRIRVRLFGGYGFDEGMLRSKDAVNRAYAEGVSMGADLLGNGANVPSFLAWATQDVSSVALQRLQIIKGWTVDGEHNEIVYDVACADGGAPDPESHRCPDNGASVDITDCSVTPRVGDPELKTVWSDPDFDPSVQAFYYVRVLENPTCRWSTWDAVRAGVAPRPNLNATIQERAWSSPIWYVPSQEK
jgi:hypothetical protein